MRFGAHALEGARWPARGHPESRHAADDTSYDGFRVIKGVALACLLSVPAWIGIGLAARAWLG